MDSSAVVNSTVVISTLISLILLYVCYTDIRYRIIHNKVVIVVFILSLVMGFLAKDNVNFAINIYTPMFIFVIGFFLSYFNLVGAGDIKLLVALTVALSAENAYKLLLLMAFVGLPLAIITFVVHKIRKKTSRCEVPYGVAIAIGYWLLLLSF